MPLKHPSTRSPQSEEISVAPVFTLESRRLPRH